MPPNQHLPHDVFIILELTPNLLPPFLPNEENEWCWSWWRYDDLWMFSDPWNGPKHCFRQSKPPCAKSTPRWHSLVDTSHVAQLVLDLGILKSQVDALSSLSHSSGWSDSQTKHKQLTTTSSSPRATIRDMGLSDGWRHSENNLTKSSSSG